MALKRILVTGASGMLGLDLVPFLRVKGYDVIPLTSKHLNLLGNLDDMRYCLETQAPEVVVHAAAYTNVDKAEAEPELAMSINKDGTRKLAEAVKAIDAIFVYVSTDFVFDGLKQTPYTPQDRPNPINTYGLSKYYGELMVKELLDEHYIIRTSWLYGIHNRNFVQFVLEAARQGREVSIVDDVFGNPTWTGSLCTAIEKIMTSGEYGTHHACDDGTVSRYEQAQAICRGAGLSSDHIKPVSHSDFPTPANRPRYSALDCDGLAIPHWETALQAYLTQYHQSNQRPPTP